ncbi:MAG: FKBP-type peptidyl-prolyl cis-trans isomerase [candidate division Zixibacteria bacterium]|nr:FKBP-type peptidyl-prolyl cis-trans isomerase [candidate division Zixibacteria bacterium]
MKKTIILLGALVLFAAFCRADDDTKSKTDSTKIETPADTTKTATEVPKIITTKSGLQYIDHVVGEGAVAEEGRVVRVHYTGWLDDNGKKGEKFDSSVDRKQPFSFLLGGGQVIPGWDEGVAGMKEGGKRELIIPSNLAYGDAGAGGVIPPKAKLIFEVELLEVSKSKARKERIN